MAEIIASASSNGMALDYAALTQLLERLPLPAGAVELVGDDLLVLFVNAATTRTVGEEPGDLIGRWMSKLPTHRGSLPGLLEMYRAVQASGKPMRFERSFEMRDGTSIYSLTIVPLDTPNRFFFLGEDITRHASLELLLRAGEAKYRAVFAGARNAIALFNIESLRCVEANDAYAALYGWSRADLRNMTLGQLGGEPAKIEALVNELNARGTAHMAEGQHKRRDGSTFPAECDAHVIQLGDRRVICLVSHDLSSHRQLMQTLLLADRFAALGTLAAGVSHEINNPLAYLLANLTFAIERLPEVGGGAAARALALSEITPALREAITGAERVKEIIADLKSFSRPELPGKAPIDVNGVLDSVLRLLQNELRSRAQLKRSVERTPPIAGSEGQLAQVFLHLLNNALESLPARPAHENRLRVSAQKVGSEVIVEVEDNGVGIAPELQRRVFDPFFTTKPVGTGSGLGLSVCHGLVEAMGGHMELVSTLGKGTTVRVALPICLPGPARPSSDPGLLAISIKAQPRVLVIDDEQLIGEAIRRMLLGEAEVVAVLSVDEGLMRLADGSHFDAVLCDLLLPGRTGPDLYAQLARSSPQLMARLGFITGGAITAESQAFVRQHADRVLEKPFSRNALRAMVRTLMLDASQANA